MSYKEHADIISNIERRLNEATDLRERMKESGDHSVYVDWYCNDVSDMIGIYLSLNTHHSYEQGKMLERIVELAEERDYYINAGEEYRADLLKAERVETKRKCDNPELMEGGNELL